MVRDDEGFSEDEIPRKKARHQKDTIDDIIDNREPMRFKGGFTTVDNMFNRNVGSQDPCEI